ncbi:MBL fold metallo-hydrolase [Clostridioides sp. ES-S-0123-01]|uniref:MBL fold metallo-hydrolase n=1 Tax=unclassified Clostridioides TaxID=2635829 RepID=UPI001D1063C5|nr:MBL fold metallo-hydrolase [Clostridioides sp. ES-S-0123-01]MCC0674166.1 MBL fold metallo-hydrolase [Clostridioides sp. ES-S-0145-01]
MNLKKGLDILEIPSSILGKDKVIYIPVIYTEDEVTLVDTGLPDQGDLIIDALNNSNTSFNKLKNIVITHHDIDHIGNIKYLREKSKNDIKVYAYKSEVNYITGEETPFKLCMLEQEIDSLNDKMLDMLNAMKFGFKSSYTTVDVSLNNHEVLNLSEEVEVIHTGGHTRGHICLYLKKSKVLIAGDLLEIKDGKLRPVDVMHSDKQELIKAIKKLSNYDIEEIVFSHGGLYKKNIIETLKNIVIE